MKLKKIYDYIIGLTIDNNPDYVLGIKGGNTVKSGLLSYKVYTALLTQSGTSAPVATVLKNTLGGTIVWTRQGAGDYIGTLTGAFPQAKTWFVSGGTVNIPFGGSVNSHAYLYWNDSNSIGIYAGEAGGFGSTLADNLLLYTSIEIRVYN